MLSDSSCGKYNKKPMLAYEKRFGVGSDERHTLQLDELRAFLEEPAAEEAVHEAEK